MFLMNCFSRGRDFLPGVSFGKQFLKGKCRLSTLAGHISCVHIEFRQLHRFRGIHFISWGFNRFNLRAAPPLGLLLGQGAYGGIGRHATLRW
jgi:hypothetical protein